MKKPKKKLKPVKKLKAKPVKHTSRLMKDIEAFHKKFARKAPKIPQLLPLDEFDFRLKFLQEEIDELAKAYAEKNLADFSDAWVDLVYVALGGAHLAGLPFDKLWAEVHKANMKKKKAKAAGDSTRGYACDVVKPKGWQAPKLEKILTSHGALLSAKAKEVIQKALQTSQEETGHAGSIADAINDALSL